MLPQSTFYTETLAAQHHTFLFLNEMHSPRTPIPAGPVLFSSPLFALVVSIDNLCLAFFADMLTPFLLSFPPLPALAPYSLSKQERFKDILSLTLDNTTAATLMRKPRLLVAAGVVYTACRLAHCGRTIEEVSAACAHRVDSKALRRLQADMCRALGLPSGRVVASGPCARPGPGSTCATRGGSSCVRSCEPHASCQEESSSFLK